MAAAVATTPPAPSPTSRTGRSFRSRPRPGNRLVRFPLGQRRAARAIPGRAPGEWLATDTHVHSDHSSDGSIWRQASDDALPGNMAVSDQIGQARRQDLDFLALTDHRTYDQHWDPLWTSDRLLLIPGEEANGRPHANILGATDTILDGASPSSGAEHRPTQQSLWDAHGQGAVMQTNHPDRDWTGDDGCPTTTPAPRGGPDRGLERGPGYRRPAHLRGKPLEPGLGNRHHRQFRQSLPGTVADRFRPRHGENPCVRRHPRRGRHPGGAARRPYGSR
ncbi:PHP domain-containing protein [Alcanivorax sp. IO_7]|nr:PHP domain-containing protein [Alcanivorax sp. IO_7]